jgi:hypothetical protein
VPDYVGHSSVKVTADIYGHRDESAELKIAEAMGEVLRKKKAKTSSCSLRCSLA